MGIFAICKGRAAGAEAKGSLRQGDTLKNQQLDVQGGICSAPAPDGEWRRAHSFQQAPGRSGIIRGGRGGGGEAHWDRMRDYFNMNGFLRFASKKFGNQEHLKTPTSSAPSRDYHLFPLYM